MPARPPTCSNSCSAANCVFATNTPTSRARPATPRPRPTACRFRFRLFADYKLDDNFFAGAAVQTSQAADSGNTTFTEGFDNYSLYLWRFFVGWHSKDDTLKFIVGKQPNPFYQETEMLWDADISPTGVTEQITLPAELAVHARADRAASSSSTITPKTPIYNTGTNTAPGLDGDNNTDAYLAYQQLVATFKASNDLSITAAPGYLFYPGHGGTNAAAATNPAPAGSGRRSGTTAAAGRHVCRTRPRSTRPIPRATSPSSPSTAT